MPVRSLPPAWRAMDWKQLPGRLRRTLTTEPWAYPLAVALGTRLALYLLLGVFTGLIPGEPDNKPGFLDLLAQWDGQWYVRIASEGYRWLGPETQGTAAFFPLYPFLARAVGAFTGGVKIGLFLVANLSFLVYLYYLYRLADLDFDRDIGRRAVVYAAVFPAAFVLGAFYTEATSFALAVASFYYARTGRWRWAILLGFLTTLARPQGIAIFLPLVYEHWRQRGLRRETLALALVPLGLVGFAGYLWYLSGSPWTLFTYQHTAWFREFTPPWETVRLALDRALWPRTHYVVSVGLLDAGSILLFTGLTAYTLWRMPRPYWLYALPLLLGALSTTLDPDKAPPTASISRFLMALFPAFLALGRLTHAPWVDQAVCWSFAFLQAAFALYFFAGHWVV